MGSNSRFSIKYMATDHIGSPLSSESKLGLRLRPDLVPFVETGII